MTDPSPLSPSDLDSHWILIGPCPQVSVWHSVEPLHIEDLPETLVDEGLDLVGAAVDDPPCFRAIHEDGLDVGTEDAEFGAG